MADPRELIHRSVEGGRDAAQRTQDRVESLLSELQELATRQADALQAALTDLGDRSRQQTDQLRDQVDRAVADRLSGLGLATQADVRRLEDELAALRKAAGLTAAGRSGTAAKPTKPTKASKATTSSKAKSAASSSKAGSPRKAAAKAKKSSATRADASSTPD